LEEESLCQDQTLPWITRLYSLEIIPRLPMPAAPPLLWSLIVTESSYLQTRPALYLLSTLLLVEFFLVKPTKKIFSTNVFLSFIICNWNTIVIICWYIVEN